MPQCDPRGHRARAFRRAVLPHRRRADLSAAVWRAHDGVRRGRSGAARLRRCRPHRSRDHPHAVSAMRAQQCGILCRVFCARPDHGRGGRLPRGHGVEPRRRQPAPVSRSSRGPRHRRLRPDLFLLHLRPHLHRRRQCHGAARRAAVAGHGVHPVSPDRDLRRRLPDHRGRARRGRLSDQQRGRALYGSLRAARQRPGVARRRQPGDDDRDPRGPRLRTGEGPHPPPPRAPLARGAAPAPAGDFGDGQDLRRGRCHARADPGIADRALQHGRHSDEPPRRGAAADRRTNRTRPFPG